MVGVLLVSIDWLVHSLIEWRSFTKQDGKEIERTFEHIPSSVGALEAEEVRHAGMNRRSMACGCIFIQNP